MFSITSVLQAFFSAAGKLFDLQNTEKEHRSETVVIETIEYCEPCGKYST